MGNLDTETHTQTYTHTGIPHYKHEDRDWGDKCTSQGIPQITSKLLAARKEA